VEGLIGLGRLFFEQGDLDQAVVQFREALSVDPQSPPAHRFLGKALMKKGEAHQAVSAYRRAVQLRPQDAVLRYELAQALEADGQRPDAVNELRGVFDLQPGSDGDAVRSLAEAALRRLGAKR
jgi:Flp pilus assembly protein TadD